MKITMSCGGGTLRVFHLASGLDRLGFLKKVYVPYYSPQYPYLRRFLGVPDDGQFIQNDHISSNLSAAVLYRFIEKTRLDKMLKFEKRFFVWDYIDRCVAADLKPGSDIVMGESVLALRTFKRAKTFGALTILDRPNTHIRYQSELVKEEYERMGMKRVFNAPEAIAKGEEEYAQADYISVLSSFVKRSFLSQGVSEKKLLFLPSGVNLGDFKVVPKEDKTFRIVYCGLACVKKGLYYLLKALEELDLPDYELWILGKVEEDFKPILERSKVKYKNFGYIPHLKLSWYYSQGSIFVLPSIEEGLAKVTMEAMACGLPVIVTPNTGAEDVMRDGVEGFIVPIRDVEALKDRIMKLYENEGLRQHMGEQGQQRVKHGLTFNDYTNRVVNACRQILQKSSR